MVYALGIVSKKLLPNLNVPRSSQRLSSRSLINLHFIFRFMIHFELIFMKGIKSIIRFTF